MTYMIHGAPGAQGAPVVAALTAAGKPVTALTRNAGTAVDGARVLAVDYSSTADLTAAYRGAEGVFVHLPVAPEEGVGSGNKMSGQADFIRPMAHTSMGQSRRESHVEADSRLPVRHRHAPR